MKNKSDRQIKDDIGRRENLLSILMIFFWIVLGLSQILTIAKFSGKQIGDSIEYLSLARRMVEENAFYPTMKDCNAPYYLHAPGYVNVLAIILRISDSWRLMAVFHAVCVHVMIMSGRNIAEILGGKITSCIFTIASCIYYSLAPGAGIVLANSEMFFCALIYVSFAILLGNIKGKYYIAGILMGLANWVRPVMFVFIPAALVMIFFAIKDRKIKPYIVYIGTIVVTVIIIGTTTFVNSGRFVYQSNTMGTNLLVGNNPVADGNNQFKVFEPGNIGCFTAEQTAGWDCFEYDRVEKQLAIEWMKANPGQVIKLMPRRLFYLYALDFNWASVYFDNEVEPDKSEYIGELAYKFMHNISELKIGDILIIISELYYAFIMVSGVVGFVVIIRGHKWQYLGMIVSVLLGTAMIMIMFGCARFHFPYMIPIMIVGTNSFVRIKG